MKIENIAVKNIVPYNKNAKKHPADQVDHIANSIKEFGFRQPLVIDKDNVLVIGHGRLMASKKLGIKEVPCVRADDLTEEQIKALRLADNKTNESEWDIDLLDIELDDIVDIDMEQFGFEISLDDDPEEIEEDDVPEEVETRCKLGDLWQLGNHRLICGDSTDVNTFEKLLDGEKADICITSPPYNASHMDVNASDERGGGVQKSTQKKYINDDDSQTDEEYFDFLCANVDALLMYCNEIFYNIGVGAGSKKSIASLLYHYQDQFKDLMYWKKENPMPVIVESVISSAVELIICLGNNNSRSFNHFNDRMFHGVIEGLSASTSNKYADVHKATFPVYFPSEIISRFTNENGSVVDCFGGTGTTMIACEQLNRKCFMVELEPLYCDIIIQRWENLTGEKAVLLNGE